MEIKTEGQKKIIFDPVRKKFIPLTPEEWVRQHAVRFLMEHFGISPTLISIEKELRYNGLKKRFDIMASCAGKPFACLVECKAPHVELTTETILQAAVYNKTYNCEWLWVTNGLRHAWLRFDGKNVIPAELPSKLC